MVLQVESEKGGVSGGLAVCAQAMIWPLS